ncbi:Protein of unknown function DUF1225 [Pyrobaculum neutrophilum V24Sta]|uniref:Transposase n=2 Tax=Pyrobaculum neutrophilum TaxID=70771 RepID=B1YD97_PYRNV|nr:Protein of unknown function DUF1225 [Pyrobaculum neutrophilum V24Sta]
MPPTRTVRLRLLPTTPQERKLHRLANTAAKAWNEVNYLRRRQFFAKQGVDLRGTYNEIYNRYRRILAPAALQQILNKNNEAWLGFFALLAKLNAGELPPHVKKVSPPGYWKDRLLGRRVKRLVVRSDRYYVEPVNGGEGYIVLKDFGMRVRYAGRIKWSGKQGRLEIVYERGRWFAYLTVEVGAQPPAGNPKGYVRGTYDRIQIKQPKGDKKAFIDIGINNLFAAVIEGSDRAILIKGTPLKAEYFWWKRQKALYQGVRDVRRNLGLPWQSWHRRYLRALWRMRERLRHYRNTAVRGLAEVLWESGVSEVYVGYPEDIAHDQQNEYVVNVWGYKKLVQRLTEVLAEYGIKLYAADEHSTSKTCSICGEIHENGRVHRGLYVCKRFNVALNADINAARNIAANLGFKTPAPKKIEAYYPTSNGLTPKRGNGRDPHSAAPAL